ncbi:hypothetical protein [Vibrio sp. WZ-1]|jgi:hypothetical protein
MDWRIKKEVGCDSLLEAQVDWLIQDPEEVTSLWTPSELGTNEELI